jgi:hypothetical protein
MAQIHADVEFMVEAPGMEDFYTHDAGEAQQKAMTYAMARGEATLDVLVCSKEGAWAYGGDDAVSSYNEDPEASVYERFEIKVNCAGRIP